MNRFILAGLLCTVACAGDTTAPLGVSGLQVATDASSSGVFVGDRVQMIAYTFDINGKLVSAPVSFSSGNPTVATISTTGLISALAAGTGAIGVSSGKIHLTFPLQVDGNISNSLQVTPANPTVALGNQLTLAATVLTTLGNPARAKSVTWSTSDATKASVDQTGIVSGIAKTIGVSICAAATDAPTLARACTTVSVQ